MTGETEETCGGQKKAGAGGGNEKVPLSFTTLSSITIQAGQSLIVVSVLKSGSLVHLQLVQVHPGLCEIGSSQEENQTLIQEQQQLMEKLKKHEREVLSAVDKSRQTEQRKRRDEGMMEQKRSKKQEEEDEVHKAMAESLKEGWSLLLRLLERRQEVLMLASDFYSRALEFSVSIDRVEELQITPDNDRLTEVQLTYDSMRRDLLGKSLQVLTSSSVLLQKLRQLQRTEALQRRGGVLQDKEETEDEESSHRSRGMALRLEELVETLQDRRRRADQAVRLQLQQVENGIMVCKETQESREASLEDWSLTADKILDQDLQSGSTSEESPDLTSDSRIKDTRDLKSGSRSDVKPGSRVDLKPGPEQTRDLEPGSSSDLIPGSISDETKDLQPESDVESGSSELEIKEETTNLQSGFKLNLTAVSRSDQISRSEQTRDIESGSRSEETKNSESGSRFDVKPESTSDLKHGSRSEKTKDLQPETRSDLESGSSKSEIKEETRNLQSGFNRSTSDQMPGSRLQVKTESRSDTTRHIEPGSRSEETKTSELGSRLDVKPESTSDVKLVCRPEKTRDLQPESRSDSHSGSRSDLLPGFSIELKPGSRPEETRDLQSGFKLNLKAGYRSVLKSESKLETTRDMVPGSRSEETSKFEAGSRPDLLSGSISDETIELQSRSSLDLKPGATSGDTIDLPPGSRSDLKSGFRPDTLPGSRLDLKPTSKPDDNRNLQLESTLEDSKDLQPGLRSDVKLVSSLKVKPASRSEQKRNLNSGSRPEETRTLHSGSKSVTQELQLESTIDVQPESRSEKTRELTSSSRSDPKSGFKPKETRNLQPGSKLAIPLQSGSGSEAEDLSLSERKQKETKQQQTSSTTTSAQATGRESMLGKGTQSREDHAHNSLPTNQRQRLLSSCEELVDKIWSWVQEGSSALSNSSEAGEKLSEAEHTLNTHLRLHAQAESAGHDAENVKQILDQIRAPPSDLIIRTSPQPPAPSQHSREVSSLKALTEQLKRGITGGQIRSCITRSSLPAADRAGSLSPEFASRVDLVLKELQSLNRRINSNLQLLQPYVTFLRTAQQVEEDMEELREIYKMRPNEEEEKKEERGVGSSRSPLKKRQVDTCWQETLQRFLTCQELGSDYIHNVTMVTEAGLNLRALVSVVQQVMERLSRTKQEVNELRSNHQIQIQQQECCRKYQERLLKTLQDLNCVSELLDSCTLIDLGSDLQTSRLLEHFSQARPHFTQLDAEVEYVVKSWETLRGVQDEVEVKELREKAGRKDDLSELLKLQEKVMNKIRQSESILDLTSRFHLTSKQLETLLQSDVSSHLTGSTDSCGSSEAELSQHKEKQQQIQNLLKTASTLKTDICTAVNHKDWTHFRVEQLEARLLSLDSLCVSWLNDAAQREQELRRELLTRQLNGDINQLRDSFKELKKRFSNLKFNYVKRNDRTRNIKAVKNQLQQVELYEEKLQALRKRLQGVTARLGSEVKDGGVAREADDAVNELQRQMGEFERSANEHQKTLEMTCRLQQAMEEYQFWCEEASATITRVGKFSSECRSTEAVSVLYQQFEKFVWPTVPQQEERISQISELAVRLHGVEEGRRYIEKTVSKHSEMVESIRELSDGLIELEAKLKMENLKKQQDGAEKEIKEEGDMEQRRENDTEEKEKKGNRKMKKKEQKDNRSTQEAADMYELKETGHTPELTAEHDGKEVPVKRQTAANRKPPLQKSRSQEADRQKESSERFTSSYCSTHTFSLSCSPAEAKRQVHSIQSQLQPAVPPPTVFGSFSDIQREFQRKETQVMGQQDASAGALSDAELQQQEVMTEDSLSNDEYECASPDDISLPPLAETPESNMVQSDVEEGFCFSSHSIHINQYHAQSEHSGTGAVRQQRDSSQTETCPTPPTSLHSSARFRSESSSFVQSPVTAVHAPSQLTSTLCSILRTGETSTASIPQSADCSLDDHEGCFPSGSNPDSCCNKENNDPEKTIPSQTEPLLKEHNSHYNHPQRSTGTQSKITQNVASKGETLVQTDPIPQSAELKNSHTLPQSSCYHVPFNGPEPDLQDKTPPQNTRFLKCDFPQNRTATCQENSSPHSDSGLHHDAYPTKSRKEALPVSKDQRDSLINTCTSTISQETIYFQSSPSNSHCTLVQAHSSLSSAQERPLSPSKTLPQIDPVHQARGFAESPGLTDSALSKDMTLPEDIMLHKSSATYLQASTTLPQDSNLPPSYLDSRSGLDQDALSSQTSKESSSVSMPKSSSLTTTTTVTQQTIYCQSFPQTSRCSVSQAGSNIRSQQESHLSQDSGGLPEVNSSVFPEPNSVSTISTSSTTITSSNRFSSKQSHQTVYSLHGSLISTCIQQCVHDPGMTPSSPPRPTATPQPEAQTQALAPQANPHVTPLSFSPHLLTPDQDPNICQPMAIREEIRLTPQIQGPPLPAPLPLSQTQAETLPQGKASKPGPPCFTRPLSRATVMEGSPVTLEVEVTGHPEPALTWSKDGEVSATGPGRALTCEDGKHFLFIPEASHSDGGLCEAWAAKHHDSRWSAGNSCRSSSSGDKWLLDEVFGIINEDWLTWFGTLCVLLWLLFLIVL